MLGKLLSVLQALISLIGTIVSNGGKVHNALKNKRDLKKERIPKLVLTDRIEMVEKTKAELKGEIVFDGEELLSSTSVCASYFCIRVSIKNTGSTTISNLHIKQAFLAAGDEYCLEDSTEMLFSTEKECDSKESSLKPGEEKEVYFIDSELMPEEEVHDSLKDYLALYFAMSLDATEEGGILKNISMEGVYFDGELKSCNGVCIEKEAKRKKH